MNQQETSALMSVAIATARVLNFTIAEGCQFHLQSSFQAASLDFAIAANEPTGSPADEHTRWLLAHVRVAQFTVAMAADALRAGPPPDMMLHEHNFFSVRAWICPLWPIC
jgi:hypothetical protein